MGCFVNHCNCRFFDRFRHIAIDYDIIIERVILATITVRIVNAVTQLNPDLFFFDVLRNATSVLVVAL